MSVDDLFRELARERAAGLGINDEEYWQLVRSSVVRSTTFLQTSNERAETRIRQLLQESGIDVESIVAPRFHEEGPAELFGVVVTQDRSAFAFGFRWGEDDRPLAEEGIITDWEFLTEDWKQSIYAEDVFHGLKALDEGWVNSRLEQ
jgi:hypothetical protein